jgi:hypothetical protein
MRGAGQVQQPVGQVVETTRLRGKLEAKSQQLADKLQAQEGDTEAEGDNLSPLLAHPRWLEQWGASTGI